MRTDYIVQALNIKQKVETERTDLTNAGLKQVRLAMAKGVEPTADIGIFEKGVEEWRPNHEYKLNDLFSYNGALGFVKQPKLTSQEIYPPFSIGTEALYGARPKAVNGVYPYVYNMACDVGMRVSYEDEIYVCYQAIKDMLFPPNELPAHFKKEGTTL